MASVYRRFDKVPTPEGAEVFTRKGSKMIRYTDRRGHRREYGQDQDDLAKMLVPRRNWYVAWTDEHGMRQVTKGFRDREASEALGRKLQQQAERKRIGLPVVDTDKITVPFLEAARLYLEDLERQGSIPEHRANIRTYLNRLHKDCGWTTPAAVRTQDMLKWLADFQKQGKSACTCNHYLNAASQFLDWCIANHYADTNVLKNIQKADERIRVRIRRALTEDQLRNLLEASGHRWIVYLTAMKTGLRRKELRKLQWGDCKLEGALPHVHLRVEGTKARRDDSIPLDAELAEALRQYRPADAKDSDRVFAKIPHISTYQRDLARAGIEYQDDQGRVADFHALRMSYNMLLAKVGAAPRVAMQCMRHATMDETMRTYTDVQLLDLHGTVNRLPRLAESVGGQNRLDSETGSADGATREKTG